jgi:hypothetical protein
MRLKQGREEPFRETRIKQVLCAGSRGKRPITLLADDLQGAFKRLQAFVETLLMATSSIVLVGRQELTIGTLKSRVGKELKCWPDNLSMKEFGVLPDQLP